MSLMSLDAVSGHPGSLGFILSIHKDLQNYPALSTTSLCYTLLTSLQEPPTGFQEADPSR